MANEPTNAGETVRTHPGRAAGAVQCVACGAKLRGKDAHCKRPAMANGTGRCSLHGGLSVPAGPGHHAIKSGRYSKCFVQGSKFRTLYEQAEADPELCDMRGDLSILTARVMELGARLHGNESDSIWKALKTAWGRFKAATKAKDEGAVRDALDAIDAAIKEGAAESETWGELQAALAERRTTALAISKVEEAAGQYLTPERAQVWAMGLIDCVLRHVTEPATRRAIAEDFQRSMRPGVRAHREDGQDGIIVVR